MESTIKFVRMWRSRPVGSTDNHMGFGVHSALVQRGIAEFVHEAKPEEEDPPRERRLRRSIPKESS